MHVFSNNSISQYCLWRLKHCRPNMTSRSTFKISLMCFCVYLIYWSIKKWNNWVKIRTAIHRKNKTNKQKTFLFSYKLEQICQKQNKNQAINWFVSKTKLWSLFDFITVPYLWYLGYLEVEWVAEPSAAWPLFCKASSQFGFTLDQVTLNPPLALFQ